MARGKAKSKSTKKVSGVTPSVVKQAENALGYNPYNGTPKSYFGPSS